MSRVRSVAVVVLAAALLAGLAGCGGDGDGGAQLNGAEPAEPMLVGDRSLPEVAPDGTETAFAFRAPEGELLAVYFGYTSCPDVCPKTMADLRSALEELSPEEAGRVSVAMVTVDPERDTPEVLNGYIGSFFERHHALRTTDTAELESVEAAFLASSSITPDPDGEGYEVSHTASTALVDDQGQVLAFWPFGLEADGMADDLRTLLDRLDERSSSTTP
ncbi:MAG: SCO family protein [Acidimicrobiales bacterium]|nr:SCO family protein [Acidimicrobiales bacterium]